MALSDAIGMKPPATSSMSLRMAAVVGGVVLGNFLCLTQTVMNVFGVVLVTIAHEFRWSRTAAAGGFTAMALASAAMMPIAGRLADRFGVRLVLLAGFASFGMAILLLVLLQPQPTLFYGLFALVGATGAIPGGMLFSKLLAQWFDENRGFWLGLTDGVGNGLGAAIIPGVAVMLLSAFGWRGAFAGAGAAVLLVGLPVAFLTLHSPARRLSADEDHRDAEGMSFSQALRSGTFWLVLLTVAFGGGVLLGVVVSLMPILTDRGLAMTDAALVIAAFSLVCVLCEPLVGFLIDRRDRPRVAAPFVLCAAVGLMILASAHQFLWLMSGAMMTSVGLGAEFSALPLLLSRYFGLRAMGTISGVAYAAALLSNALSPLVFNRMFDVTGSYGLALDVVAGMMACSAMVLFVIKRFPQLGGSAAGDLARPFDV